MQEMSRDPGAGIAVVPSGGSLGILEEAEGPWQIILTTFAKPQNFVGGHCQGNVVEFADNILGTWRLDFRGNAASTSGTSL